MSEKTTPLEAWMRIKERKRQSWEDDFGHEEEEWFLPEYDDSGSAEDSSSELPDIPVRDRHKVDQ